MSDFINEEEMEIEDIMDQSIDKNNDANFDNNNISEENIEAELNNRLKEYIGDSYEDEVLKYFDPEIFITLKIDESKLESISKSGFLDKSSFELTITEINNEIHRIHELLMKRKHDSDFYDNDIADEALKKFIKTILDIKYSVESLDTHIKNIDVKKILEDATNAIYPKYQTLGPAMILNLYLEYIENRISVDSDFEFLIKEITTKKKVISIFENSEDRFFKYISTKDYKITYGNFIIMMYERIRLLLAKLVDIDPNEITINKVEDILLVLNILFLRFIYKKFDVSKNVINRYLMRKFIVDLFSKRNNEYNDNVDNVMNKILILMMKIIMKIKEKKMTSWQPIQT